MPPRGKASSAVAKPPKGNAISAARKDEMDKKINKQAKQIDDLKKVNRNQRVLLSESRKTVRTRDASILRFANALERVAKQLRRNTTKGLKETAQFKQECKERYDAWRQSHDRDLYGSSVEWQRARASQAAAHAAFWGRAGTPVQRESGSSQPGSDSSTTEDESPNDPTKTVKNTATQAGGPIADFATQAEIEQL